MLRFESYRLQAGLDSRGEWVKPSSSCLHTHLKPLRSTILKGSSPGIMSGEIQFPYLRAVLHLTMTSVNGWTRDLTDVVSAFLVPLTGDYFEADGPVIPPSAIEIYPGSIEFPGFGVTRDGTMVSAVTYEKKSLRFQINVRLLEANHRRVKFTISPQDIESLTLLVLGVHRDWCRTYPSRTKTPVTEAIELQKWIQSLSSNPLECPSPPNLTLFQRERPMTISIPLIKECRSETNGRIEIRPCLKTERLYT